MASKFNSRFPSRHPMMNRQSQSLILWWKANESLFILMAPPSTPGPAAERGCDFHHLGGDIEFEALHAIGEHGFSAVGTVPRAVVGEDVA